MRTLVSDLERSASEDGSLRSKGTLKESKHKRGIEVTCVDDKVAIYLYG